jgi:hypothetical protein
MEQQTIEIIYTKKYGIIKNPINKCYQVLIDGKKWESYYKNKEFALKKAEAIIKNMFKPFCDFNNRQVKFNLICLNEINSEDYDNRFKSGTEKNFI